MALTLDRKSFIDILRQGEGEIGALMPPRRGVWGNAARDAADIARLHRRCADEPRGSTGIDAKGRLRSRQADRGQDSTLNLAVYLDPAAIQIDQLKEIGIGGELHTIETATGYCDPGFDKMVDRQSMEANPAKRKNLVWDTNHKLQADMARLVIYHLRAATCWLPEVKGLTMMVNSQYNGWRFEDAWLDK